MFRTNAGNLAARQRYKANLVDQAMKDACRMYGAALTQQARTLSKGPISTAELSEYKPGMYSTKRPARPAFDAIINAQTGLFASSWHFGTWAFTGHVTVTVYNTAPYAKYMMGTARMRERPILDEAMQKLATGPEAAAIAALTGPGSAASAAVTAAIGAVMGSGASAGSAAGSRVFAGYVLRAKRRAENGTASVAAGMFEILISTAVTYGSAALDA